MKRANRLVRNKEFIQVYEMDSEMIFLPIWLKTKTILLHALADNVD